MGDEPGQSKAIGEPALTERQRKEAYARYKSGRFSMQEIADWYAVHRSTISRLVAEMDEAGAEIIEMDETDAHEWLKVSKFEETIAKAHKRINMLLSKIVLTEGDKDEIKLMKGTIKDIGSARKVLKDYPIDLKQVAANVDEAKVSRMVSFVMPEHRAEFVEILKGLSKPGGSDEDS